MGRPSKTKKMSGSFAQFKEGQLVWDEEASAYFVRDVNAKRRYGPYNAIPSMDDGGTVVFVADGGKRAKSDEYTKPATLAADVPNRGK